MRNFLIGLVVVVVIAGFTFKDTISAMGNLENGAGATFMQMWDRWEKSNGDIAYTTVWEKKVEEGVEYEDVVAAIKAVGIENNMKEVGELPLGKELNARGVKSGILHVMSYCSPDIARIMVDFTAAAAAYLPCRVTIVDHGKASDFDPATDTRIDVDKKEGLWIYTLNMDMMITMGRKMPPEVLKQTMIVRQTIWDMLERGAAGDF